MRDVKLQYTQTLRILLDIHLFRSTIYNSMEDNLVILMLSINTSKSIKFYFFDKFNNARYIY